MVKHLRRSDGQGRRLTAHCWMLLLAAVCVRADNASSSFERREGTGDPTAVAEGYTYQDPNALDDGNSRLAWRYGRRRSLFEYGRYERGWSLDWATAPAEAGGFSFQFRGAELDADFADAASLGLDSRWLGTRRQDVQTGFDNGTYALQVGRDALAFQDETPDYLRDYYEVGAYGLNFRREEVRFAADSAFGGPLQQALLSTDGYGLSSRRLGAAAGGYTDVAAMAGNTDLYHQLRFEQGGVSAEAYERTIDDGGGVLTDRAARAGYSGITLRWAERRADAGFADFKPTGYAAQARLSDGHEDTYQAAYAGGPIEASYGLTRTLTALTGDTSRSDTWQGAFGLRPVAGLSLGYERIDRSTGALAEWSSEGSGGPATYHEDAYRIERGLGFGSLTLQARQYQDRGDEEVGGSWQAALQADGLGAVRYSDQASRDDTGGAVHSRTRAVAAELGLGLSAESQWRTVTGSPEALHYQFGLERELGIAAVSLGWERWRRYADPDYAIAGAGDLLDGTSSANAYDASVTLTPGSTQLEVHQRWLLVDPGSALPDQVTETGVVIGQRIYGTVGVEAGWSRYAADHEQIEERREVAVSLAEGRFGLVPSARVGYRERKTDDGVEDTWFGAAVLQPYGGFRLSAEVAQTAGDVFLGYRDPVVQRAVTFGAEHALAADGSVSATYTATPIDATLLSLEDGVDPLDRQLVVAMALPPEWLHPSLKLSGQFRLSASPGIDFGGEGSEHEQTASLAWLLGESSSLSVSYHVTATRGSRFWSDPTDRLELGYSGRILGRGEFSVQGWLNRAPGLEDESDSERYRLGVRVGLPF